MAAAAAEQRHASAGLAQDLSSLQPPNLLRTMAADGGLDDIPDPTAMTDSQRARMAEELIQRTLAEPSPDEPVFTGGELDEVLDFRLGVAARVLHTWRTAGTPDRGREGAHSPVRALLRAHLHVARRPSA